MNGEHPWLEWLLIALIMVAGAFIVWGVVQLLLYWARKENEKPKPPDSPRKNGH